MKVFLDDVRNPSDCIKYMYSRIGLQATIYEEEGWWIARSYDEFVNIIDNNHSQISLISFDHDLSSEHYDQSMEVSQDAYEQYLDRIAASPTGYECAMYVAQLYHSLNCVMPKVLVHSMNPVGVQRIKSVFGIK